MTRSKKFSPKNKKDLGVACHIPPLIKAKKQGVKIGIGDPSAESGNDGSNDRTIPFTPVSICTCTSSITSYRATSVRMSPMVVMIMTKYKHILPQHLALL